MILDIQRKDSEYYDHIIGIRVKYPDYINNTKDGNTFTSYLEAKYGIEISDTLDNSLYKISCNDSVIFSNHCEEVNIILAYDTHKNELFVINKEELKQYSASEYPIDIGAINLKRSHVEKNSIKEKTVEKDMTELPDTVHDNSSPESKSQTAINFDSMVDFIASFVKLMVRRYPVYQIFVQMSCLSKDFIESVKSFTVFEYITQFEYGVDGIVNWAITRCGTIPVIFVSYDNDTEVHLYNIEAKDQNGDTLITFTDNT